VFVIGGSKGLGKEMSKVMASQGTGLVLPRPLVVFAEQQHVGAHITIFARGQTELDEAKDEILASRRDEIQQVAAIAADLSIPSKVSRRPVHVL
jgi:3-dehydrosphinganine reductase